jgi:hypothetical protein
MRAIDAGLTSTGAGGITVLPPLNRSAASEKPKYRLVLYQRDLTRKLLDHEVGLRELQMRLGSDWSIEVYMHTGLPNIANIYTHISMSICIRIY